MQIVGWTVSRRPTASVSRRAGAHVGATVDDGFAYYTQRWRLRQPTPPAAPLPFTTMDTGRRKMWGYVPSEVEGPRACLAAIFRHQPTVGRPLARAWVGVLAL